MVCFFLVLICFHILAAHADDIGVIVKKQMWTGLEILQEVKSQLQKVNWAKSEALAEEGL